MSKRTIQDLRERRAACSTEARKLLDEHPGEKWGANQTAAYDKLVAEMDHLDGHIKRHERILQDEADEKIDGRITDHSNKTQRDLPETDPRRIFDTWLRGGDQAVTNEQWTVLRNTMSTTTGSEGGFTVPSLIASQLIDAMKAFGAMRGVAEILKTADGKPLSFPTSDGTAEVGEIIAQNVTATGADPVFGTVSLNVFKYSSKIVAAPIELLQDTTIDMESFIRRRLAQRLGRIGNQHFTTGVGTTTPDGIVTRSAAGKVGQTGQTTTIIYDDLIDLIHSVDPAYRGPNSAFMTSDTLLRVLRKLKDTAGRPLWIPNYDSGIRFGANNGSPTDPGHGGYADQQTPVPFDFLAGYPVWVNNDMAVPAANAKSLIFGDFNFYKIRDAMEASMFRFTDSAYTKLGQVGFLAWARMGGNLVDTAAVKYYAHSAT